MSEKNFRYLVIRNTRSIHPSGRLFLIDFPHIIDILQSVKFYPITNGKMHQNINLTFFSETLTGEVEKSIMMYLHANIEQKMDAYFKKVLVHPDARIMINAHIEKNKDGKFDGRFTFTLNGKTLRYEREGDDSFRNVHDLVNHAFDHLKEQIADEHK